MKLRQEVKKEDRWNVEAIYPDLETWKADLETIKVNGTLDTSRILKHKGRLGESPEVVKLVMDESMNLDRKISNLYTWIHLKHDEDISENNYKQGLGEVVALAFDFQKDASWIEPELIALSEATQKNYLESATLKPLKFHLENIFRLKKHTLSHEKEEIVSQAMKAMQSPNKAFSALNDADITFPDVIDKDGNAHPLSHATYQVLMRSRDRDLRERTFRTYIFTYKYFQNTMAELIFGCVQKNVFQAKVRNFSSSLEAALYPKNIDVSVYHALIQTVRDNIDALHDYYKVRGKALGIDRMHIWDQMVPITPDLEIKMSYDEAEDVILKAIAPLGEEYVEFLRKGFKDDRWVDRYENKNKRSGAYSSGSYDTQPYILMNYKDILRDVFTLAHEAGHSMHSLYTTKNQPYQYGSYPIFLAEVASTFNEELLSRYMLKNAQSRDEKIFLVNQKLEDIKATLFRQTMFAEFEMKIHELAEKDIPLTPELLKAEYYALNKFYYGDTIDVDQEIEMEWARIPHFYYNFYVYQYATGVSAALALAERVSAGNHVEREEYLSFLKSGCSRYPLETLKLAGVDMSTSEPVKMAINTFRKLTKELALLLEVC